VLITRFTFVGAGLVVCSSGLGPGLLFCRGGPVQAGGGEGAAAPGQAATWPGWLRCLELWSARACEGPPALFSSGGAAAAAPASSEVQEVPARGEDVPRREVAAALAADGAAVCRVVQGGGCATAAPLRIKRECDV
jgi:hypothetical protein